MDGIYMLWMVFICYGWYLYAVEICLRAQNASMLICAKECGIQHLSTGTIDRNYMRTYRKILLEYKDKKWIATTCRSMLTNMLYYHGYYAVWRVKKALLGNYPLVHRLRMMRKQGKYEDFDACQLES